MNLRRRKHSDSVPPLSITVERTVRFEEIDPMNIMWHGRYASWLEDGRETLGRAFGVHYMDFYHHGVVIPLKLFHLDFHQPLRYEQRYAIQTTLHWSEAALLDIEYRISNPANGDVMTTAATTQLMTDLNGQVLLEAPRFYQDFCLRWKQGEFAAAVESKQ